jgi:site-specific DNA-methyltransferase (adenine-specific)
MGSGSTLVAASSLGRRFVGYELDPDYVALARERVAAEGALLPELEDEGRSAGARCLGALEKSGFSIEATERRVSKTSVVVDAVVSDAAGVEWHVDFGGPATSSRPGLSRPEVAFRVLGRLSALRGRLGPAAPLLVLTTAAPEPRSESEVALRAAGPGLLVDVVDVSEPRALARLERYATGERAPLPGFWQAADLA